MECSDCDNVVTGKYCPDCGRRMQPKRIDGQYIVGEISSVLSFKKGILYTIKELLIRPGKSIRVFIHEDRNRLVKPVVFVIFCSFIYTMFQQVLHFEDGYFQAGTDTPGGATQAILGWVQTNYGYANIISGIFMAVWVKILFPKRGYNFFEVLILLLFVFGIDMLVFLVFGLVEALTGFKVLFWGIVVVFVYTTWAIGQFFDGRKVFNYFKALMAYILGSLFFGLAAVFTGKLIDYLF